MKYKETHPGRARCDEFMASRHQNPKKHKSLYYQLLRKKLAVAASMIEIESIRFEEGIADKYAGGFLVTVRIIDDPNKGFGPYKKILLNHVDSPIQVPESGTVSVKAVVIPIDEYVMPSKK